MSVCAKNVFVWKACICMQLAWSMNGEKFKNCRYTTPNDHANNSLNPVLYFFGQLLKTLCDRHAWYWALHGKMLTHPAGSTTGSYIAWIWTGKVQVLTDYSNQNCLVFIEEKKMILCCLKVKTLLSMAYAINRIKCSYVVPISVLKCQVHLSGDNSMQTRHPS